MGYNGNYLPLKDYLESSTKIQEELSYKEIELILKNELPCSAYSHREWWSNGGHHHSNSWIEAGWKVERVELGEKIVFIKNNHSKNENRINNINIDFGCSLEDLKLIIIEIIQQAGCVINPDQIQIIDRGKPHIPRSLNGKMGIYIFIWGNIFLKIGKANFNSNARFQSQHYNAHNSKSNLSKSILNDSEMKKLNLLPNTVGDWIKENTRRVDIIFDKSLGFFILNFIEAFLQLKYKPKYEGFKNQRKLIDEKNT